MQINGDTLGVDIAKYFVVSSARWLLALRDVVVMFRAKETDRDDGCL